MLFGLAVVVLRPWLAGAFTDDAGVRHLVLEVLWIVAALQPVAAIVFVLDGVLIGAGDAGYLALAMLVATVGVYLPAALLVAALDGGLLWLWGAIALWMLARFVGMAGRFRTTRWEVAGADRAPDRGDGSTVCGDARVARAAPASRRLRRSLTPRSCPSPTTRSPLDELLRVDAWGRSEPVRALARTLYDPVYRHWLRAEWEGLEHVPLEGGALLIANHAARSRRTRRW